MTTTFGRWVCLLELDADEPEVAQLVTDLKARLGDRVRTTTKTRWLYDEERRPLPPRTVPSTVASRRGKTQL